MRKIHVVVPILAIIALVVSFSVPGVYADPSFSIDSPLSHKGPVGTVVTTSGSGFDTTKAVYIFFNGVRVDSAPSGGSFSIFWSVPLNSPGTYQIQTSYDPATPDPLLPSVQFEVTSSASIPEFPFSFSLVIIFVAIAAMYVAIRQKMTANFRPF